MALLEYPDEQSNEPFREFPSGANRSWVWNFFLYRELKAQCQVDQCYEILSRGKKLMTSSTSPLKNHLSIHGITADNYWQCLHRKRSFLGFGLSLDSYNSPPAVNRTPRKRASGESSRRAQKQSRTERLVAVVTPPLGSSSLKDILLHLICIDDISPGCVANSNCLRNMIKECTGETCPREADKIFALLREVYLQEIDKLRKELKTFLQQKKFISLVVVESFHVMYGRNFSLSLFHPDGFQSYDGAKSVCLGIFDITEHLEPNLIAEVISTAVLQLEIPWELFAGVTTNGCSKVQTALSYFFHTIQLCLAQGVHNAVSNALKGTRGVMESPNPRFLRLVEDSFAEDFVLDFTDQEPGSVEGYKYASPWQKLNTFCLSSDYVSELDRIIMEPVQKALEHCCRAFAYLGTPDLTLDQADRTLTVLLSKLEAESDDFANLIVEYLRLDCVERRTHYWETLNMLRANAYSVDPVLHMPQQNPDRLIENCQKILQQIRHIEKLLRGDEDKPEKEETPPARPVLDWDIVDTKPSTLNRIPKDDSELNYYVQQGLISFRAHGRKSQLLQEVEQFLLKIPVNVMEWKGILIKNLSFIQSKRGRVDENTLNALIFLRCNHS